MSWRPILLALAIELAVVVLVGVLILAIWAVAPLVVGGWR